jgi:predicted GH43/DUF377 family glycosyl hydrolase
MQPIEVRGEPQLLEFRLPPEIADFYVLSPFAMYRAEKYEMVVRLVNRDDDPAKKISRIHYAASEDGVRFEVGREVITPGGADEPDSAGCEDPPSQAMANRTSSSTRATTRGNNVHRCRQRAAGASTHCTNADRCCFGTKHLQIRRKLRSSRRRGGSRMFFEYARDGASHIDVTDAAQLDGPWTYGTSPLEPRSRNFDSWHLSPSSVMRRADGTHVLFYNGSSKETAWRINYAILDETATVVVERPQAALIHPFNLQSDDADIAFAASALLDPAGAVWLYYSIADRTPYRSQIVVEGAVGDSATLAMQ